MAQPSGRHRRRQSKDKSAHSPMRMPVWRSRRKALLFRSSRRNSSCWIEPVLVGRKRARQIMLAAGCVLTKDQAGQNGEVFGPGQFLQHAAQMEEVDGISDGGQRGLAGAQGGEPGQDVRIAAQLLEGLHLRVLGAEKIQKIADGAVVETNRLLVEGSGERLGGALKQAGQADAGGEGAGS